jgi:hypothetical protein
VAAVLALALLILGALWIRQAEVIALVTQIAESVPPIPALAALLFLVALNGLSRRFRRKSLLSAPQTLMVFSFLAVSLAILGPGIARFLFANLTAPFYFASPENNFADLLRYVPPWFVPKDPGVIRGFYEGSRHGVPWAAWLPSLSLWLVFLTLLWLTLLCLTILVRRQWMENERLSFPQLYLPLQIAEEKGSFFRNPIMWMGFGLSAAYDLVNIAHALWPWVPSLAMSFPLGDAFVQKPWDALKGMTLYVRPEMMGLGYLVSLEVSFSVWFFSLLIRAEGVAGRAIGLDVPGFPFPQEQGIGLYVALAGLLLWGVWKAGRLRGDIGRTPEEKRALRERNLALAGLLAGFCGMVAWMRVAGLALWIGALFFALILAVALVYCRIRAETGVPLIWGFPFGQHFDFILNLAGSHGMTMAGSGSLVVLTNLAFLSRGYFPEIAAYQLETIRLGEVTGEKRSRVYAWMIAAVPAGFAVSFVLLLVTYYARGAANVGLWGTWAAVPLFEQAVSISHNFISPKWDALAASGIGFAAAFALTGLRWVWLSCPFHPLGYAMATSYGDLFWGPFLIVWALKWAILRYGGNRLYTRLIPGFLGLALGHFFVAGALWGAFGAYLPEALPGYQVWFG